MAKKKGLLERLSEGPVIGDGGFCLSLEKRGYVRLPNFTPFCTVLHPDAVLQLHRDFSRCGADVMQAFNMNSGENRPEKSTKQLPTIKEMNLAAYKLARQVANEGDALVSITVCQTDLYAKTQSKREVQQQFRNQIQFFEDEECAIDFIICEYFSYVEEIEWAIAVAKEFCTTVVASMCIGPYGDKSGVSTPQCAVRMTNAGADVVGANCKFGPLVTLDTLRAMKEELDKNNLKPYLISQPLGFFTPEIQDKDGYMNLPEIYLANEPRVCTRFEAQKYAREAYELGVRYIGGCCGFEPYHIRAISEELSEERKKVAPITEEFGTILSGLKEHPAPDMRKRSDIAYWKTMCPSTGRPHSSAFAPIQESATIIYK